MNTNGYRYEFRVYDENDTREVVTVETETLNIDKAYELLAAARPEGRDALLLTLIDLRPQVFLAA